MNNQKMGEAWEQKRKHSSPELTPSNDHTALSVPRSSGNSLISEI